MPLSEEEPRLDRVDLTILARDLLGGRQDADDVAQDVWVLLRQQQPGRVRSLGAWLGITIRHLAARARRRERRRVERERIVARPDRAPSVIDFIEQRSQQELLAALVDGLAEPYREVVRLRYLEECEIDEIATRAGRSPATVRSQIKRGLDQLRARLDVQPSRQRELSALLPWLWPGNWFRSGRRFDKSVGDAPALVVGTLVCALVIGICFVSTVAGREALVAGAPNLDSPQAPMERLALAGGVRERVLESDAPTPAVPEPPADPWDVTVEGSVVDPEGRPVPGAAVVIANWDASDSEIVGSTDSLGHYRVERVDRRRLIWAEDPGKVQSRRHLLASRPLEQPLDLELGDSIGTLVGQVLSSQGLPISRAEVTLISGQSRFGPTDQNTLASGQQTAHAQTGVDGRFRVAQGMQSSFTLLVQAEGHTPLLSRFERKEGQQEVVITLPPPGALQGQVTRPDGAPAVGVRLELVFPDPMPRRETTTGEGGRFDFSALPAGRYGLRLVEDPTGAPESCFVEGILTTGERASVSVALAREHTIHGRALEGELPLAGWRVELEELEPRVFPRDLREARTSPDGSFAFPSCQLGEAHVVRLFPPEDTSGIPRAVAWDVRAGQAPVVLRTDAPESLPGSLAGRFESAKSPPAIAALRGEPFSPAILLLVDQESGEFSAARLPPGRYELQAWIPNKGTWEAGPVTILPGRATELSLPVPELGRLSIVAAPPNESALDRWSATVDCPSFHDLRERCVQRIPRSRGKSSFSARLFPGDYDCWLKFENTEVERRRVHIEPGMTTEEELVLQDLVAMTLQLTSPHGGLRRGESFSLFIRTASSQQETVRHGDAWTTPVLLPRDARELRVETTLGLTGTLTVTESDLVRGDVLAMRLEDPLPGN